MIAHLNRCAFWESGASVRGTVRKQNDPWDEGCAFRRIPLCRFQIDALAGTFARFAPRLPLAELIDRDDSVATAFTLVGGGPCVDATVQG